MEHIVTAVILILLSILCFVISTFQFKEKGFLFNNAYLYASKEERQRMDKKPHYRQSAIAFLILGCAVMAGAIEAITGMTWLFWVILALCLGDAVYAIVSSVRIEKKK